MTSHTQVLSGHLRHQRDPQRIGKTPHGSSPSEAHSHFAECASHPRGLELPRHLRLTLPVRQTAGVPPDSRWSTAPDTFCQLAKSSNDSGKDRVEPFVFSKLLDNGVVTVAATRTPHHRQRVHGSGQEYGNTMAPVYMVSWDTGRMRQGFMISPERSVSVSLQPLNGFRRGADRWQRVYSSTTKLNKDHFLVSGLPSQDMGPSTSRRCSHADVRWRETAVCDNSHGRAQHRLVVALLDGAAKEVSPVLQHPGLAVASVRFGTLERRLFR